MIDYLYNQQHHEMNQFVHFYEYKFITIGYEDSEVFFPSPIG